MRRRAASGTRTRSSYGPADRLGRVNDHLRAHHVVFLRGVQRVALTVADDVHVAVGLHAGGDGPEHLFLVVGIDVGIDHDHVLHEVALAQGDQRRLFTLAVDALVDADVAVVAAGGRNRQVHPAHARHRRP